MLDRKKVATKNDWDIQPMPKENEEFFFERHFSDKEISSLRNGNIPQEMEDKWFWYMEDDVLYAHRSWTGICVYIVYFDFKSDKHKVVVNRLPEQYSCKSVKEDIKQLNKLLDYWSRLDYNPYDEWVEETLMSINKAKESKVSIVVGDITKLDCDCIVNAANNSLLGGGGVDGAIHRAAGPELLQECMTLNGCPTGEAKITGAYNLPCSKVIHTVGPIYSGKPSDADLLRNCYMNSLELARDNDLHSIAFPAISTGVYRYPLEDATKVAIDTVSSWLSANEDYNMDVFFCCYDEKTRSVYDRFCDELTIDTILVELKDLSCLIEHFGLFEPVSQDLIDELSCYDFKSEIDEWDTESKNDWDRLYGEDDESEVYLKYLENCMSDDELLELENDKWYKTYYFNVYTKKQLGLKEKNEYVPNIYNYKCRVEVGSKKEEVIKSWINKSNDNNLYVKAVLVTKGVLLDTEFNIDGELEFSCLLSEKYRDWAKMPYCVEVTMCLATSSIITYDEMMGEARYYNFGIY